MLGRSASSNNCIVMKLCYSCEEWKQQNISFLFSIEQSFMTYFGLGRTSLFSRNETYIFIHAIRFAPDRCCMEQCDDKRRRTSFVLSNADNCTVLHTVRYYLKYPKISYQSRPAHKQISRKKKRGASITNTPRKVYIRENFCHSPQYCRISMET